MKCHNAKIGSQFSVSRLRQSPSFRRRVLSRTGRVAPCSGESSPTLLKKSFIRRKNIRDQTEQSQSGSSFSAENVHLLVTEDISAKDQSLVIDIRNEQRHRNSGCPKQKVSIKKTLILNCSLL